MKLKIYPSMLCADLSNLESELKKVSDSNPAGVHIDVMDGKFVEKKAFDFELTKKISELTNDKLDIHFMVKNPEQFVLPYLALNPSRISIHIEESPSINFIKKIQKEGISAGIVVDLPTKIEKIKPYLDVVDFIIIMSVKCGAGGQKFSSQALEKIKWIRSQNFKKDITVDGGINSETSKFIEKAGATSAVMGSAFFKLNI